MSICKTDAKHRLVYHILLLSNVQHGFGSFLWQPDDWRAWCDASSKRGYAVARDVHLDFSGLQGSFGLLWCAVIIFLWVQPKFCQHGNVGVKEWAIRRINIGGIRLPSFSPS